MARLFKNQEDLLSEFGQFLPDANSSMVSFREHTLAGLDLRNVFGAGIVSGCLGALMLAKAACQPFPNKIKPGSCFQ